MTLTDNTDYTVDISNILESCLNDHLTAKFLIRCDVKVCTYDDKHFHFVLCQNESFVSRTKVSRHVRFANLADFRYVKYENVVCLSCRKNQPIEAV